MTSLGNCINSKSIRSSALHRPRAAAWICATLACSPFSAIAAVESEEESYLAAEDTVWRASNEEATVPVAGRIEIIPPTKDETVGVILFHQDGEGRPQILRFGGPR